MLQAGQSVHIGGLVRLDLVRASVETIYITVWASHSVSLHLGKTENSEEILKSHSGLRLQVRVKICSNIKNVTKNLHFYLLNSHR